MTKDLMRYDLLTQNAMRGVLHDILTHAEKDGLPGEHHFFITFATCAPGVEISDALLGRHPADMTIVLQHQFWGLEVDEHGFAVSLTFNKIPERLKIPFSAIRGFYDPSVQFGLQFPGETDEDSSASEGFVAGATKETYIGANPESDPNMIGEAIPEQDDAGEVVSLDAFRKKS